MKNIFGWSTADQYIDDPKKPFKVYSLEVRTGGGLDHIPISQHESLIQAMDFAEASPAKAKGFLYVDTPEWKTWKLSGLNWVQITGA